jgi:integrase
MAIGGHGRDRGVLERLLVGSGYREHGLMFAMPDGRPIHPERFSREFAETVARSDFPRIRLHDLRHTWATLALQAGVHPKVVQERLGHSNIAITLDIYSHVVPAMQTDAADRVASIVLGGGPLTCRTPRVLTWSGRV